jgi:hypothetical protein
MSKSADVGQATKGYSVLPVPQSGRAEFRLHPLCQLAPARQTAGGLLVVQLKGSAVMNYVSVAVVIVLVSIVYEFTVMSWVIAAQEHIEDERARRY